MRNINERLDEIQEKMEEDQFIEGRGLGNEISFYIFDYNPKHELIVRDHVRMLKQIFSRQGSKRHIIEFDLYQLLLSLTKKQRIFDTIFDKEAYEGKQALFQALVHFAQPELFLNEIENQIDGHNVIFITGVGKAYPFIRSHTILNNLQERIDNIPVIMFYPGEYDGQSLNLFGEFKDDNYYRAFRLID